MTKLSNILKGLTFEELEELIEIAQHKINELKAEKKVKLIREWIMSDEAIVMLAVLFFWGFVIWRATK